MYQLWSIFDLQDNEVFEFTPLYIWKRNALACFVRIMLKLGLGFGRGFPTPPPLIVVQREGPMDRAGPMGRQRAVGHVGRVTQLRVGL